VIYAFGACILDADRHELRHAGQVVAIEPKVFQVLLYLLQHRDRVVTKDDLFTHCWPESFVSEAAVTRCLAKVRQAVQASRTGAPVIKTIHGHGYRFVAAVTTPADEPQPAPAAAPPPHTGREAPLPTASPAVPEGSAPLAHPADADPASVTVPRPSTAERRQLTVLSCTLADAARLASQLDPEDLHVVVQGLHAHCTEMIQRFAGHIAQYRRDGLLVYFGYPQAQENDAEWAGRAGLGLVDGMSALTARLASYAGGRIAVQVGIHTGPVIIGEMGGGDRQDHVALGETPNVAASLEALAMPDTVVVSAATARLVEEYFVWQALGEQQLPGMPTPLAVYRVLHESGAQTRLEIGETHGLTPLVGRAQDVRLLVERWEQAQAGDGQVVLLSGEAGIGKSRVVEALKDHAAHAAYTPIVFRGSPYHQHSAFAPVIAHLQQVLRLHRGDAPAEQLDKLEQGVRAARLPLDEVVPLVAALLSIPVPERYAPLPWSPQQQKQKTEEALVAWLLAETERQPVLAVWEDLHWADPSSLEFVSLCIEQAPTARLFLLLTCRPVFQPPWSPRSYLTHLTLGRLGRDQVAQMVAHLTGGKTLPAAVWQHILTKTEACRCLSRK
jgi:class 3 adenylate cyclase/DNA-binding winged helix-turn-helix (wHTH) protein